MTLQEILKAFPAWANAHGIVATPENDEAWTPTPDGAPALVQMTYIAPNGARLRLPADVMALEADKDGTMAIYLEQVMALYGKTGGVQIAFSEFTHPKPIEPSTSAGVVGGAVPRDIVSMQASLGGRIDAAKAYFFANTNIVDGARVSEGGRQYIAVKPNMFAVWLQLIG